MSDISVSDLRGKVDQFLTIKEQISKVKDELKSLEELLRPVSQELDSLMEAMELTRFEGSKGKVNRVVIDYVNSPQTDEDREQFFSYLREEGMFEAMASVNYQKLNSYFKDKLEMAQETGEALHIPGLQPQQRVEIRKGR